MKKESIAIALKKIGIYDVGSASRRKFRDFLMAPQLKRQLRDGEVPLPHVAIMEITDKCNMSCDMCWLDGITRSTGKELGQTEIMELIDKLPSTIREVTITGGEPLLRDDIYDVCKRIKMRGIEIMLLTNGYLTARLKELREEGLLKKVNISLDGTEEVHNSIRGRKDAFLNAIESMRALMKDGGVEAHFLTVINRANLSHLKRLVDYLKKNGFNDSFMEYERRYDQRMLDDSVGSGLIDRNDISHLKISSDVLPGYSLGELEFRIVDLERHAVKRRFFIRYLTNSFGSEIAMWYSRSITEMYKVRCDHFNIARIDAAGNLIPCFAIRKNMGNLLTNDFDYLWNSEGFRNFRSTLLKKNLLPICTVCYLCHPYARKEIEVVSA